MDSTSLDGVRLYRINADARRIVARIASQYRRQEPYATLIDTLQAAGEALALPGIRPTPAFLNRATLSEL